LSFCRRFFSGTTRSTATPDRVLHPARVHYGRAEQVRAERAVVLDAAYAPHPERFVRKPSALPKLPTVAWINQPTEEAVSTTNP
jgi:putative transposase